MNRNLAQRRAVLARIEGKTKPVVARISRHIANAAVASVRNGHAHVPVAPIMEQLVPLLVTAYDLSYKAKKHGLHLSFVDEVSKAATRIGLDPGDLHRSFTTSIRDRISDAASSYEDRIDAELRRISAEQLPTRTAIVRMRQATERMGLRPWRHGVRHGCTSPSGRAFESRLQDGSATGHQQQRLITAASGGRTPTTQRITTTG